MTARMRNDDSVPRGCKQRSHLNEGVNVVRPAMQQDDHRPIVRAQFGVTHVQDTGIDLLDGVE